MIVRARCAVGIGRRGVVAEAVTADVGTQQEKLARGGALAAHARGIGGASSPIAVLRAARPDLAGHRDAPVPPLGITTLRSARGRGAYAVTRVRGSVHARANRELAAVVSRVLALAGAARARAHAYNLRRMRPARVPRATRRVQRRTCLRGGGLPLCGAVVVAAHVRPVALVVDAARADDAAVRKQAQQLTALVLALASADVVVAVQRARGRQNVPARLHARLPRRAGRVGAVVPLAVRRLVGVVKVLQQVLAEDRRHLEV